MLRSRRPALLAPALLLAAPLQGQQRSTEEWLDDCRRRGDRDREVFCEVRSYDLPALRSISVDAKPNGGVRVTGWDRGEIRVVARIRAHAPDAEEARSLAREVTVTTEGGRIDSDGPRVSYGGRGWSVSFDVYVPRQTDLDLQSTNGAIAVSDVRGELEMRTTNGGISLDRVAGDVRGETTNGGLSVRLDGNAWQGRGLDLETTNGGIEISVPEGYSAEFRASTTNGGISTDLPLTVQGRWGRQVEGRLGSGGAPIEVSTTNGGIRLRRR